MGDQTDCLNCGVTTSTTPREDGLHPVQKRTAVEGGEKYCQACAFGGGAPPEEDTSGEYKNTGDVIATAAEVDETDEELAALLVDGMQAEELRRWMSAHGLTRTRGSNKMESAVQAVGQDRARAAYAADAIHGLSGGEYTAVCDCGFERSVGSAGAAEDAASSHKSENPRHFPKAWGPDGERLYG